MADGATARIMKADTVVDFDVALIERARKGDAKAFERLAARAQSGRCGVMRASV